MGSRNKCWFCGSEEIVISNEHYIFCRNCMALYTYPIVSGITCVHIDKDTPLVLHECTFKASRARKAYILEWSSEAPEQYCSVCYKTVSADGW